MDLMGERELCLMRCSFFLSVGWGVASTCCVFGEWSGAHEWQVSTFEVYWFVVCFPSWRCGGHLFSSLILLAACFYQHVNMFRIFHLSVCIFSPPLSFSLSLSLSLHR